MRAPLEIKMKNIRDGRESSPNDLVQVNAPSLHESTYLQWLPSFLVMFHLTGHFFHPLLHPEDKTTFWEAGTRATVVQASPPTFTCPAPRCLPPPVSPGPSHIPPGLWCAAGSHIFPPLAYSAQKSDVHDCIWLPVDHVERIVLTMIIHHASLLIPKKQANSWAEASMHLVFPLHLPQLFCVVPHVLPQLCDLLLHCLSFLLPLSPLSLILPFLFFRIFLCHIQGQLYLLLFLQAFFQSPLQEHILFLFGFLFVFALKLRSSARETCFSTWANLQQLSPGDDE